MEYSPQETAALKFRQLIPGILVLIGRLPKIIPASIRSFYAPTSIGAVIERNATRFPEKAAILFEDDRYTYGQYNEAVNRYAHYFLSSGLRKGDVAVVLLENRPELLIIIGALAKIGAVSSLVNPRHVGQSLTHSINIHPARSYIVGEETIETFKDVRNLIRPCTDPHGYYYIAENGVKSPPHGFTDLCQEVGSHPATNPRNIDQIAVDDAYAYFFTSGTTGLPKAAILSHHRWVVAAHLTSALMGLTSKDTVYVSMPLCHTSGHLIGWSAAFGCGAALAVARRFSASRFWEDVRRYDATSFLYVGETCRYLMNQSVKPDDRKNPVRKIAGNGLRPDIYRAFKDRFSIPEVFEFYGATEGTTGFFNLLNVDCTLGLSLFKKAIVKYDVEKGTPVRDENGFLVRCEKGETGLLLGPVGGKVAYDGYTSRDATEEKILRDVFKKGDTWFNTGDLIRSIGYGHAVFVDRIGDTFRWKSENVSTSEVENVVNETRDVIECVVYGVEIPGTEGRAGMAAIRTNRSDEDFDFEEFHEMLSGSLPAYAVPIFVRFLERFETTPTHKLIRNRLQEQGFDPHIVPDAMHVLLPGSTTYVPLTTALFGDIVNGRFRF